MQEDNLMAALAESFGGDVGDTDSEVTIKSIRRSLQAWLLERPVPDLSERLQLMEQRLAEAARMTRQDLQGEVGPELAALMQATLGDYLEMEQLLRELAVGVESGRRDLVKVDLEVLQAAAESLAEHDQAMRDWMHAPVLRCPRCGEQNSSRCPACGLDTLYPDAEAALHLSGRTASLGPEYLAVYRAYQAVVRGELTMAHLLGALAPLEASLIGYAQMARAERAEKPLVQEALDVIAGQAEQSLRGLDLMRGAAATRRTRDLREGWSRVFESALQIQQVIPTLARSEGGPRPRPVIEDAVFLQGE